MLSTNTLKVMALLCAAERIYLGEVKTPQEAILVGSGNLAVVLPEVISIVAQKLDKVKRFSVRFMINRQGGISHKIYHQMNKKHKSFAQAVEKRNPPKRVVEK